MRKRQFTIVFILFYMIACGTQESKKEPERTPPSKSTPQELSYETFSVLIQDMNDFSKAVKALQQTELQRINERYKGVTFQLERVPLFLNTYADPSKGGVVFLVFPKDPQSGSNYLLTFDRALPVIQDQTVELQFRTRDPEKPLECVMKVPDASAYLSESKSHKFLVRFALSKSFLQSGTYDFDALTVPSYRTRGYAFVVFDLVKAELLDTDANVKGECMWVLSNECCVVSAEYRVPITDTLDLHTFAPQDIKIVVEEYLYQCNEKGFSFVRIIHGKGVGIQREMVRSILSKSSCVESFEDGPDWGSTAIKLRKVR